jgi:hypothetical protein
MSDYNPDKWMVIKITGKDLPSVHKVFACWAGGYLDGDSWKLNSGITKVTDKGDYFFFDGSSGSTYACRKGMYGATGYGYDVLKNLIDKIEQADGAVEILSENTDWTKINYE